MILGITIGMRYLHKKGIYPYLFCPQTILIDNDYLFPIISEFEVTPRILYTDQAFLPESDKLLPYRYSKYDYIIPEDNIFTFSLIVYQIITKRFHYIDGKKHYGRFYRDFTNGKRPNISCIDNECVRKLIMNCWDQDPKNRMSFDQILNYITNEEFINSFRSIDTDMVKHYLEIYGDEFKEIMNKF